MKLVVLGSGSSIPHPRRTSSAYWLETHGGTLLLDASADAPHRMAEEGLDWANLDAIWVSHFHLDHLGGIAPYLFAARWAAETQKRSKLLRIYGARGLISVLNSLNDANNYKLWQQRFPVELVEVRPGEDFEILPDLKATTISTPHKPESMAIRLTDNRGTVLVYTSDTGVSGKLVKFAARARLLLLECSFRRNKPLQNHLELAEAMRLAKECAPDMLVLTHFFPEWDGIDVVAEAKQFWPGETLEAVDGLRLEI